MIRTSRPILRFACTPRLAVLEDRCVPATIVWQGGGVGDPNAWSNANNWVGGKLPLAADIAKFDTSGISVVVDTAQTVTGIELTTSWSGTFTISATILTTTGASLWNRGVITGVGTWSNSGTVSIAANTANLFGITLNNSGTITHSTASNIDTGAGAVINNLAAGVIDFQTDGDVNFVLGPEHTINNKGLIRKTGGMGDTFVRGIINNQGGTWESTSGQILMQSNGGTHTGGMFTASPGATVNINGGFNAFWEGTYKSNGGGIVGIGAGTVTIGVGGATFDFPTGTPFGWYGGFLTGGTLTNNGFIDLPGGNVAFQNSTIDNAGTIRHLTASNLDYGVNAVINNKATGVYEFHSDGDVNFAVGPFPTFNNSGIVRKMVGGANSYINGIVNNLGGTWDAQSGSLSVASQGGTHTGGTFTASSMASIDLTGTHTATWTGTYTGSGAGIVGLFNGQMFVGMAGATLNFPTQGLFQWHGGLISGATLTNKGFIDLPGNTVGLSAATLSNEGTIRHLTASNLDYGNAATINNQLTGIYQFQSDGDVNHNTGSFPTFNNFGIVRKLTGIANSYINGIVNNKGGTWDAQSGSLSMASQGGTHSGGTFKASAMASIDLAGNQIATWTGNYTGSGGGLVGLFNGQITPGMGGLTFNFATPGLMQWHGGNINGGTFNNDGFIDIDGGGAVSLQGATTVFNNSGTIRHNRPANLDYGSGATFNNLATGVYEFRSDGDVNVNAGPNPTFNNLGIVRKLLGPANSYINGIVNNKGGTWDAQSGSLSIASQGGAHTGGTFTASSMASIDLTGTHTATWTGNYSGSGAGIVGLFNGQITPGMGGATFNFATPGLMQWHGGSIIGGSFANAGFLDIDGGGAISLQGAATVFNNSGTIRHNRPFNLDYGSEATINNLATGVYEFRSDGDVNVNAGPNPTFNNFGIVRKLLGPANSSINGIVNNQGGTWDAQSGSLSMASQGGTHTGGTFTASSMASIDLTGANTATWTGSYTGSGAGIVGLFNGQITPGAGGATFNITTPGLFQWHGGSIGDGKFTNSGFLDLEGGGPINLQGIATVFNNSGTIRHNRSGNLDYGNEATINNLATGVYEFRSDGDVNVNAGPNPTFNNFGIVRKLFGAGQSDLGGIFNNTNLVEAKFGTLNLSNIVVQYDAGKLTAGTWFLGGGTLTFGSHGPITTNQTLVIYSGSGNNFTNFNSITSNEGTVNIINNGLFNQAGTWANKAIVFIEAGSTLGGTANFNQNAGTTTVHGNLDPNGTVLVTGGLLTGLGKISSSIVDQSGGTTQPGPGVGNLTVDGQFKLSGTGLIAVPLDRTLTLINNFPIDQSGGTVNVTGNLVATVFNVLGGKLMGTGAVTASVCNLGGSVEPGASPGFLTINGIYAQVASGSLNLELNGPTAQTQYDRLIINGAVTLGGKLDGTLGYKSVTGENFVILTNDGSDTISTTFTSQPENSTVNIGGSPFRINYNAGDGNDVVLTRIATGIQSIVVDDGSAQRSMVRSFTVTFAGLVTLPMIQSDAFELFRSGPVTTGKVPMTVDLTPSTPTQTIAKLSFSGPFTEFSSLIDGRYSLTVFGNMLTDQSGQLVDADNNGTPGGNNLSNLHRLFGDADGNATVNTVDFNAFRNAFGGSNPIFDFDGLGGVGTLDFNQFRLRFGSSV